MFFRRGGPPETLEISCPLNGMISANKLRSDQLGKFVQPCFELQAGLGSVSVLRKTPCPTQPRSDSFNVGSCEWPRGSGSALVGCRRREGAGMDEARAPKSSKLDKWILPKWIMPFQSHGRSKRARLREQAQSYALAKFGRWISHHQHSWSEVSRWLSFSQRVSEASKLTRQSC